MGKNSPVCILQKLDAKRLELEWATECGYPSSSLEDTVSHLEDQVAIINHLNTTGVYYA